MAVHSGGKSMRLWRDRATDIHLVHYAAAPFQEMHIVEPTGRSSFKPDGLWVSDDECEDNWRTWCESEGFRLGCLTHRHEIALVADANVAVIHSAVEIDLFTSEYRTRDPEHACSFGGEIDWARLAGQYDGLIITPYIWARRLSFGDTPDARWYYSWDCASGCIWHPRAIGSVRLREIVPLPVTLGSLG